MKNLFLTSLFSLIAGQASAADWFQEDFAQAPAVGKWELPAQNARLVDGALQFTGQGDAGRVYLRTMAADYAKQSFIAEATVTIPKGVGPVGIAFFGLGCGQANPGAYHSPNTPPALYAMVCPSGFSDGHLAGVCNSQESKAPGPGDGTHRIRMIWDAATKRAKFEISPNGDGKGPFAVKYAITVNAPQPGFTEKDARLFLGAGAGTAFDDFGVHAATAAEIQAAAFGESFVNDPSARTWLPTTASAKPLADAATAPIDAFLKELGGTCRPLVCWYSGAQLAASRAFANGEAKTAAAKWVCQLRAEPVADDKNALDLTATFKLDSGTAAQAGVALAFDFANWRTDNYVMLPCSVYNGNRNRIIGGGYAQGQPKEDYYKKDSLLTTRDIPRLALDPKENSSLEVLTNNLGTPCIAFMNRQTGRGFILLAEQAGRDAKGDFLRKPNGEILDHAFAVEETADRSRATLVVSAPGVRERKPEFIGFSGSPDRGQAFKAGDVVTLKLRLYAFDARDMTGFYEKFMTVRKAVTGPNHPRKLIPASQVETWMAQRIDSRFHNGPEFKFYCPENAAWISFGWIGGLMNTFPMLVLGDNMHLERVTQTFDFAIPRGQGEAGYFYGALNHDGKCFGREGYPDPKIALSRKNADVLYWMMKQFQLLKAQGRAAAIKPAWEQNIKRLADAFVTTWKKDGEWGNYVHVDTGEVVIYNSSSAVQAPGGLALASVWYNNPDYLRVAKEAADFYYRRDFLGWGATTGHSADTLQNADGDSPMAFAASLVALYEVTGDKAWLEKARNILNLQASWTTSFDYELPKFTELGRIDAKLTGVIWASTQNKHAAPGHCTSACEPLLKVYRATGDTRYAELLRDIVAAHGESIRPGGFTNERLTYCDADSRGDRGNHVTGWNETNGIMMAQELPGIYLQTDADRFYVFDAVEARMFTRDAAGIKLEIKNPTKFDAKVSILAETGATAQKPLGNTAFLNWPKVEVKAGATRTVIVSPEGKMQ